MNKNPTIKPEFKKTVCNEVIFKRFKENSDVIPGQGVKKL
jgi:hypothetical protein